MDRNSAKTDDTAASWLQQRESDGWTQIHEADLENWLAASTANRVAFLRLEAAWEETGRLHALAPGFPRRAVPDPEQLQLTSISQHRATAADTGSGPVELKDRKSRLSSLPLRSLAATILITVIAGTLWYLRPGGDSYVTPVGGLTSVPLKDGSSIALNTASKIRVHLTDTERRVELAQGEAYFEVAKDPKRPFTVRAADKIITAVGTAFSVRKVDNGVQVIVAEGTVKVQDSATPSRAPTYLTAGGVIRTGHQAFSVEQKPLPQAEELLSWRTGYVVFRNTPLPTVIAEFNRYNDRKIEIANPALDTIRLTGKFRATNTDALIRLLEKSFQVSARQSADHIALTQQEDSASATE